MLTPKAKTHGELPLVLGDTTKVPFIVFLHGGPGMDFSYFRPSMDALDKKYPLLFYRQGSQMPPNYTMEKLVSGLEIVLKNIGDKKFILLGHSFGGALALEYLRKHKPKNLIGLILISWVYDKNWILGQSHVVRDTVEKNKQRGGRSELMPNELMKRDHLAYTDLYFSKKYRNKGREIFNKIKYNASLQQDLWSYLEKFDSTDILKKIDVPVLSILGKSDPIVSPNYIRKAYPLIKNLTPIEIENCSHFPFIESKELTLSEINKFIAILR